MRPLAAAALFPRMKSSSTNLALIGLALAATAGVGYSLGRLTSPEPAPRLAAVAPSSAAATSTESGAAALAAQKSEAESDVLASWFGGERGLTLEQVTNGRPLDEHLRSILKQDDEVARMLGFLRVLETLKTSDELKSALDVITTDKNGRFRPTELSMLLQKWAQLEPKSAAEYAAKLRDWSRFAGMDTVLRSWVKTNPEEAIAWAAENNPAQQQTNSLGGRPEDGNWAVASLIGPLSKNNLQRAIEVAASQPVSRARGRMMDTLIGELISQRGEDGARDAVATLTDESFRAGMASQLATRLASKDPAGAAKWAQALPAGDTRQKALTEVVGRWANQDAVAAGSYLQQLGSAPEFDSARQRYAQETVRKDPDGALTWAAAITDPKQRTSTMEDLVRSWMRRDQPAAQEWVAKSPLLAEDTRAKLLGAAPQNAGGRGFGGPRGNR